MYYATSHNPIKTHTTSGIGVVYTPQQPFFFFFIRSRPPPNSPLFPTPPLSRPPRPGSRGGRPMGVPPERAAGPLEGVLNRLSQRVRIEGFRPGRAPRPMIEARLGAAAIRDE